MMFCKCLTFLLRSLSSLSVDNFGTLKLYSRPLDPFRTHPKNTHLLGVFWVWVHPFRTYPSETVKVGNPSHTYPSWVGFLKAKLPKIAPNTHRIPKIFGILGVWVGMGIHSTHLPVRIFVRKVPNTHLPRKIQSGSKALEDPL